MRKVLIILAFLLAVTSVTARNLIITDFCTFLRMNFDDEETPMKFRSPDGTVKQVTLRRNN